jgi:hypothetical protein
MLPAIPRSQPFIMIGIVLIGVMVDRPTLITKSQ